MSDPDIVCSVTLVTVRLTVFELNIINLPDIHWRNGEFSIKFTQFQPPSQKDKVINLFIFISCCLWRLQNSFILWIYLKKYLLYIFVIRTISVWSHYNCGKIWWRVQEVSVEVGFWSFILLEFSRCKIVCHKKIVWKKIIGQQIS